MTTMIEVKVAELSGPALDWAVAKAVHGVDLERFDTCCGNGQWNGNPNEPPECCGQPIKEMYIVPGSVWRPSEDWAQGGPLLAKYFRLIAGMVPSLDMWPEAPGYLLPWAMRKVVEFELGDTVSVPAELVAGAA